MDLASSIYCDRPPIRTYQTKLTFLCVEKGCDCIQLDILDSFSGRPSATLQGGYFILVSACFYSISYHCSGNSLANQHNNHYAFEFFLATFFFSV